LSILQKRPSPHPTSSARANPRPAMRPSITGSSTFSRPQSPRLPSESIHACADRSQPLLIASYATLEEARQSCERADAPGKSCAARQAPHTKAFDV
jgi:hypothetical protein